METTTTNTKKLKKGAGSIPNKALHSRVSYLYQAAMFLASQQVQLDPSQAASSTTIPQNKPAIDEMASSESETKPVLRSASRRLVSDLRSVSLKVQIRMSPAMKRSICKNCDTILVDSSTCVTTIENKSKGGRKPWADVLVQKCNTCGYERRVPLGTERQSRRPLRVRPAPDQESEMQLG